MRTRVLVVVTNGVGDGSLGVVFDVFRAAAHLDAARLLGKRRGVAFDVRVLAPGGSSVTTASGRRLEVDGGLPRRPDLGPRDVVLVPGLGLATPHAIEEAFATKRHAPIVAFLARAATTRALLAASCSGTFLLAETGLLDGREATTTWWLAPVFRERFPKVTLAIDRALVASGRLLTAGSSLAIADLLLSLVARAAGPALAHLVARYLLIERRPPQSRFMIMEHLRGTEPALQAIEAFVLAHLASRIELADLARAAGTSARTLARLFDRVLDTTPMRFVQRIRVEHAARLLETTAIPFDTIAAEVGYGEPGALRRLLRRELGASPGELRAAQLPSPFVGQLAGSGRLDR